VVAERIEDRCPKPTASFDDEFVKLMKAGSHDADTVDYHHILADFDIIAKVNSGAIDGLAARLPTPLLQVHHAGRALCNTRRSAFAQEEIHHHITTSAAGELLENIGHRAGSIHFRHPGRANLRLCARYERPPGQAEVGVHAPTAYITTGAARPR
jgi:hypothetical protein